VANPHASGAWTWLAGAPMRAVAAAACASAALALACAHPARRPERPEEREAPPSREGPKRVESGLASYYARRLEGRRTANGERYQGARMTCAHRTHPFGAVLRVTDVESGRAVLVEVNDRGPFESGRIVDLSWAAARALGMLERGLARVKVERVR
jgi:rare lipoprotein A